MNAIHLAVVWLLRLWLFFCCVWGFNRVVFVCFFLVACLFGLLSLCCRFRLDFVFFLSLVAWLGCSSLCVGRICFGCRLRVLRVLWDYPLVFGRSRRLLRVCFLGRLCWLVGRLWL